MASWCLPKQHASAFLDALKSGKIEPEKLAQMSSAERRAFFEPIVGIDHAAEVNSLFESKLLLKDQQRGLVTWAKAVAGLTEPARADIVARISRMDKVLQPADEHSFLSDLAARKLGVTVSADEAQQIFNLSQKAEAARTAMLAERAAPGYKPPTAPQALRAGTRDSGIAYGNAVQSLADYVDSLKPNYRSWGDRIVDILNIPKSALTSIFHLSAPFVQGWGMISTARAWQGFGQMLRYFANEENYSDLNAYIISHPDYQLARAGKLGLTALTDRLSAREEAIQSTLVEKANEFLSRTTGVPNLVRASSRAFTGYLNFVRFNRFADLLNAARLRGEDVSAGSSVVHDLAKVVNDFTGRGAIGPGDKYAQAAPTLNALFFSPRKISATIQMFEPTRYLNPAISPTARIAAIRQLTGSLLVTGAVLALAKAMGANVNFDPRSADFAKVGIGGEKLDMTGGNATYLRLLARLAGNQEVTASGHVIELGQGYKPTTRADLVGRYLRGKLSPVAGTLADALYGSDPAGQPFSLTSEAQNKLLPITINDFINFARNDPDNWVAIAPALSAIFGVGLESPLPQRTAEGMNIWGTPMGMFPTASRDPVDLEFQRLGHAPGFPLKEIRGVPLDDRQYADYIRLSGQLAKTQLDSMISLPQWGAIPDGEKLTLMRKRITKSRETAAVIVMLQSMGTDHDIVRAAHDAKLSALGTTQH